MSERATIECKPNGPCLVKDLGDLRNARSGRIEAKPVMALCRCGGSKNKPFCDGAHWSIGFKDASRWREPARRISTAVRAATFIAGGH